MTNLFIVCSGLGNVNRGYESFTRECFDVLSIHPDLKVSLWKGGGDSNHNETALWNLPRDGRAAKFLGKITRRGSYFIEQITFVASLLPYILRLKPDVVFFSDGNIGNLLWHYRRFTRAKYKLLFSNGGPLGPPFLRWDHVQQVAPTHLENALVAGEAAEKQSVVPYGIQMQSDFHPLTLDERRNMRKRLDLPLHRPIIISVAAINATQKRVDYLLKEFAALSQPRPFLLLLGQQDEESPDVLHLAHQLLSADDFVVRTVTRDVIDDYYKVADIFVLASLHEGFGRVFLEAASHGLPCLAHDCELTRYVLSDHGYFANFEEIGSLTRLIKSNINDPEVESKRYDRHNDIYRRFSWDTLVCDYVSMVKLVSVTESRCSSRV